MAPATAAMGPTSAFCAACAISFATTGFSGVGIGVRVCKNFGLALTYSSSSCVVPLDGFFGGFDGLLLVRNDGALRLF